MLHSLLVPTSLVVFPATPSHVFLVLLGRVGCQFLVVVVVLAHKAVLLALISCLPEDILPQALAHHDALVEVGFVLGGRHHNN